MLLSLPANPVPAELYQYFSGSTSPIWLPWYVWGGGVYATKYGYDTTKYIGYLGTISVPLVGAPNCPVIVKSLRVRGSVTGKIGTQEGALLLVRLWQRTGNLSTAIATVFINRLTVTVGNVYIDVTQSAGAFAATPSIHSLAIEIVGEGQGLATVDGLFVDLQY